MIQRLLTACLFASVFALSATPAHSEGDAVSFGSSIHVRSGTSVHDAVCFFCSVHADGTVEGDVVVFFGNVHIAGAAHHDVVDFFGNVTAEDDATIGHSLVSFFGVVRLGENVSVGQDLVAMFGGVNAPESVTVGGNRVQQPAWLFFMPLLVLASIIIFIVHEIRSYRRRQLLAYSMPPYPPMPPTPPQAHQ